MNLDETESIPVNEDERHPLLSLPRTASQPWGSRRPRGGGLRAFVATVGVRLLHVDVGCDHRERR